MSIKIWVYLVLALACALIGIIVYNKMVQSMGSDSMTSITESDSGSGNSGSGSSQK